MTLRIRPYHPSDLTALYRVCLLTGDNGSDASHLYSDPDLLAHYYLGPYLVSEPDLAFVLTKNHRPIGYAVATRDSAAFGRWCESEWFPALRLQYPLSEADSQSKAERDLIESLHRGHRIGNTWPAYPAHLHIDILPAGQGHGMGRKLMTQLWQALRALGVPGVYLGVGKDNQNAVNFYRHIGFEELEAASWGYILGKKL